MIGRVADPGRRRRRSRGSALVEMTLLIPAFLLIIFGMIEFGFVFDHNLTLEYATREGARMGAALATGGNTLNPCDTAGSIDPDPYIIAAVQRVLTSPGSPVASNISSVDKIMIWKSDPTAGATYGTPIASETNTWTYTGGGGSEPTVDGVKLKWSPPATRNWDPCERNNTSVPPDSIGVSLSYTYRLITPLAGVMKFFGPAGPATYSMSDRTVMSLNPTN